MESMKTRLEAAVAALEERFLEREELIRLALLGVMSGENVLLVGPPGTAKSQLARAVSGLFGGEGWFEYLLTRFTTPDEVFGPVSLRELKMDRYVRQTEGYLPSARFAFLDEIFKSGSAILNALLSLLNERIYYNGREKEASPLLCLLAASNELPEETEGLGALYDRFLIRYEVGFLKHMSSYERMFTLPREPVPAVLSIADVERVRERAARVVLPEPMVLFLFRLKTEAEERDLSVSDRRWRKIGDVWRTSAALNGRDAVSIWDAVFTPHMLWDVPEALPGIQEWFEARFDEALEVESEAELPLARFAATLDRWKARKQELFGHQFKKEMKAGAGSSRSEAAESLLAECRDELETQGQNLRRALVRFHERERGRADELRRLNALLPDPAAAAAKYATARIRGERVLHDMLELYRSLFDADMPGVDYDFTL
ncbi:AAA family ATPase [Paenibacillus sp.]|uniref:AAA family ATPase n=1 Tax=Paenibacillus sp. TaxID=58172 RepID=UPI002811DC96|nr:AAA family ATPase [Paenibacillus sp.]